MGFGFGRLRLSSRDFWALTPAELAAAARHGINAADAPPERRDLEALMRLHPDRT